MTLMPCCRMWHETCGGYKLTACVCTCVMDAVCGTHNFDAYSCAKAVGSICHMLFIQVRCWWYCLFIACCPPCGSHVGGCHLLHASAHHMLACMCILCLRCVRMVLAVWLHALAFPSSPHPCALSATHIPSSHWGFVCSHRIQIVALLGLVLWRLCAWFGCTGCSMMNMAWPICRHVWWGCWWVVGDGCPVTVSGGDCIQQQRHRTISAQTTQVFKREWIGDPVNDTPVNWR